MVKLPKLIVLPYYFCMINLATFFGAYYAMTSSDQSPPCEELRQPDLIAVAMTKLWENRKERNSLFIAGTFGSLQTYN